MTVPAPLPLPDSGPNPPRGRIFLSPPHVGDEERAAMVTAFDSNWIAPLGPEVDAFEQEVAERVGVAAATALSSGTAGLHLALSILGIGAGDDVLTSSLTFAATANAIRYVGARPCFVDCSADTWTLCPDRLAEELSRRAEQGALPKAVVTVDLYGQCCDYDRIIPLCREYGVKLIQDAAEALGATHGGRPAGAQGDVAVFSFNGNKIITTSGGGMLVSDDVDICDKARFLASQARDDAPHYQHTELGYNYRLSNLLAALGRAQLRRLDAFVARRRAINAHYRRRLAEFSGVEFMGEGSYGTCTFWLTCLTIEPAAFGVDTTTLRKHLARHDIEARPVWKPMHLQPLYQEMPMVGGQVCEGLFARGLCLPSGTAMTEGDVERVVDAILEARAQGGST